MCDSCYSDIGLDHTLGNVGDRYDLIKTPGGVVWMNTSKTQSETFALRLDDFRTLIRDIITEEAEKKEKKPNDPRKFVGKIVTYVERPFRVFDIFEREMNGYKEVFLQGVFEDDPSNATYYAPVDKVTKRSNPRVKKPPVDEHQFTAEDIRSFLAGSSFSDGIPNIDKVRSEWAEISSDLTWLEKYIFDTRWLVSPEAKSHEEIATELGMKVPPVRAAEFRAFRKIEKFVSGDNDVNHDLRVVKQARAMHKANQPMAKIIVFLQSELKNKEWLNQIDFLK
jgi:hypothetical protein